MSDLIRLRDWEPRLVDYLIDCALKTFSPGQHDCALFTAGAVAAMTGVDLGAKWRGKYSTLKAGQRKLLKAGLTDHVALAASLLPEIAPAFAGRGDVAVVPGDGGMPALGIVQGEGVYVVHPQRLAIVDRLNIMRAFKL